MSISQTSRLPIRLSLDSKTFWPRFCVIAALGTEAAYYLYLLFPDPYQQWKRTWYAIAHPVIPPWSTHHLMVTTALLFLLTKLFSSEKLVLRLPNSLYRGAFPLLLVSLVSTAIAQYASVYPKFLSLNPSFHYWFWTLSEISFLSCAFICWVSPETKDRDRNVTLYFLAILVSMLMRVLFQSETFEWHFAHQLTAEAAATVIQHIYPNFQLFDGGYYSFLQIDSFAIILGTPCSGTESLVILLLYLGFWFLCFPHRISLKKALYIIPLGVCCVWLANLLRVLLLVFIGKEYDMDIAVRGFHSSAGWIFFNVIATALLCYALNPSFKNVLAKAKQILKSHTARYLVPLLALLAVALVTNIVDGQSLGRLYVFRIGAAVIALILLSPLFHGIRLHRYFQPSWRSLWAALFVLGLWIGFEHIRVLSTPPEKIPVVTLATHWWRYLFWIVGSSFIIPIVEEVAFRGYLMRRISKDENFENYPYKKTTFIGLFVSSLLFAGAHVQLTGALIAGLVFGWLAIRENRLGGAVFAHGATNFGFALYVALSGNWALVAS